MRAIERDELERKKSGLQKAILAGFSSIIWGMLVGLIINGFMWHHEGYKKLMKNIDITYQEQVHGVALRDESIAVHESAWISLAADELERTKRFVEEKSKNEKYLNKASKNKNLKQPFGTVFHVMNEFYYIAIGTFKVMIAKFISVFSSVWVFVFAAIMGGVDGLLKRYIRTNEAGRESTFIFHRVSDSLIKIPVGLLFLYLTLPIFIRPEVVALMMSVTVFLFFYTATANLKKFL